MPRDAEEILNDPISADDFQSEDFPEAEEQEDMDPDELMGDDDLDIEDDEIDPVGDIGLGGTDFNTELEDDSLDLPDNEPEQPKIVAPEEQVRWTVVPQENGDIWSEHVNGFVLRARPLSAQKGPQIKYAAQLFKDQKMIENGTIWIDKDTDATEYLQNVADRILDRMGLTNLSKMQAEPE